MNYSAEEVMEYVKEEDVKFVRLAFTDVYGRQKNITVMPNELPRAFEYGIAFDASAIKGFGDEAHSDLFLHPDPATLMLLPWRPEHGKVVRMFCSIKYPDGSPYPADTRSILIKAMENARAKGLTFNFGPEYEFYLFRLDETGAATSVPYDNAGYMDAAPVDKCENVRREICLALESMGILPESSHHEEGPGQNEIDFRYSDPLSAADNALTFRSVVETVAARNGLHADFSPKPVPSKPGNGLHVNFSVKSPDGDVMSYVIAGILDKIKEITLFLNPDGESYDRLGHSKAPQYISWSTENRSQLIRIPAAGAEYRRAELRSPDPTLNPYIAFTLLIKAGVDGYKRKAELCPPSEINFFTADDKTLAGYDKLPSTVSEARDLAAESEFVKSCLPEAVIRAYCEG